MRSGITDDFLSALQAKNLLPVLFVQITFETETVYLSTLIGSTSWNGQTWQGVGSMLGITSIEEGTDVSPRGITVSLSGFDANLLPLALNEVTQGLPVIAYFGLFYISSPTLLINSPLIAWAGRTDQPEVDVTGAIAEIKATCENRLVAMNVAVDRRYTNEDQQRDWPGDTGLSFVYALQDKNIYWGRLPGTTNQV